MSTLAKFGMLPYQYDFAADTNLHQLALEPESFENIESGLNPLPGMDGGIPSHWAARGASSPNDIKLSFKYTPMDRDWETCRI